MMDYSPEMQEAFRMYFFDGYSLEEVADKLGVWIGYTKLYRKDKVVVFS
jgi:DNA-directed RNA polymerase specialized sigma24 family protein